MDHLSLEQKEPKISLMLSIAIYSVPEKPPIKEALK